MVLTLLFLLSLVNQEVEVQIGEETFLEGYHPRKEEYAPYVSPYEEELEEAPNPYPEEEENQTA